MGRSTVGTNRQNGFSTLADFAVSAAALGNVNSNSRYDSARAATEEQTLADMAIKTQRTNKLYDSIRQQGMTPADLESLRLQGQVINGNDIEGSFTMKDSGLGNNSFGGVNRGTPEYDQWQTGRQAMESENLAQGRSAEASARSSNATAFGTEQKNDARGSLATAFGDSGIGVNSQLPPGTDAGTAFMAGVPTSELYAKPPTNGTPTFDAEGEFTGMVGGSGGFTRKVKGNLQGDVITARQQLNELKSINELISPDLFEVVPQVGNWIDNKASKLLGKRMNETDRDYNKRKQNLFVPINQAFNKYRKEITGAAAAVQELDRLMKGFPNNTDSYEDFTDKLSALQDVYKRNLEYYIETLESGMEPNRGQNITAEAPNGTIEAPDGWESSSDVIKKLQKSRDDVVQSGRMSPEQAEEVYQKSLQASGVTDG